MVVGRVGEAEASGEDGVGAVHERAQVLEAGLVAVKEGLPHRAQVHEALHCLETDATGREEGSG